MGSETFANYVVNKPRPVYVRPNDRAPASSPAPNRPIPRDKARQQKKAVFALARIGFRKALVGLLKGLERFPGSVLTFENGVGIFAGLCHSRIIALGSSGTAAVRSHPSAASCAIIHNKTERQSLPDLPPDRSPFGV